MNANNKASTTPWVDPDEAPELTDEFFSQGKKMIGNVEVTDTFFNNAVKTLRGNQKAPTKDRITIRLSHDTVEHLRASGKGWQTRLDTKLHEFIASGLL